MLDPAAATRAAARHAYMDALQRELNPSVFVTEWLSFRLMNVWLALDSASETTANCVSGIDDILIGRGFAPTVMQDILARAPASAIVRCEFLQKLKGTAPGVEHIDPEALALCAIFCFLHLAFLYEVPNINPGSLQNRDPFV